MQHDPCPKTGLDFAGIMLCSRFRQDSAIDSAAVDGVLRMARRVAVLVVLAALGLTLSGCGPCGFEPPWATACRGGPPVK